MMQVFGNKFLSNCFDFNRNDDEVKILDPIKAEALRKQVYGRLFQADLEAGLAFRTKRETVLISGAGIAGLAASFELAAAGCKVLIAEKRKDFSRSNIINFNSEIRPFLEKFGLLNEFEEFVAARIQSHRVVHVGKKALQELRFSDVSVLKLHELSFVPENFDNLFNEEGIYSVKIKDLQTFLAKKAMDAGVQILGNVQVEILAGTHVKIRGEDHSIRVEPSLLFVAEGAHSATADKLGFEKHMPKNSTEEHWIYGNVKYSGKKSFVVSIVSTTEENLIANVIFNANSREANVAVTSTKLLDPILIRERILKIAKLAFGLENIEKTPRLITVVERPVHVKPEKRNTFSKKKVFIIGDAAGHGSPLAGLGGTLSFISSYAILKLLSDRKLQSKAVHKNFNFFMNLLIDKWMDKSRNVKEVCLGIMDKEQRAENGIS